TSEEKIKRAEAYISKITDLNAKVRIRDMSALPLLVAAYEEKNMEVVRLLINKRADVNQKVEMMEGIVEGTPLMYACCCYERQDSIEFIHLCMNTPGVDLNTKDNNGSTLLDYVDAKIRQLSERGKSSDEWEALRGELETKGAKRGGVRVNFDDEQDEQDESQ
ncbi:MAG: hypothetical protein LBS71_00890, partial [Puniceicoccales bacterium]|nr:hypothetical protein [Puniceicoccales bacterium]